MKRFCQALTFVLLLGIQVASGQHHKTTPTKPSSQSSSAQPPPAEAAHTAVMKFMGALKIANLPEGREALQDLQWITGPADRGSNFYSKPEYTSAESLYAKLFDTDHPNVQGYKEFFSLQGLNQAGATKTFKYLVIAYKNQGSNQWKILSSFDDADGSDSSFDFQRNITFFRGLLEKGDGNMALGDYLTYAKWSLLAGHLNDAASALSSAKSLGRGPDVVTEAQITELSATLDAIVQ